MAKVSITGDARSGVKAIQELQKAMDRLGESTKKTASETAKEERAAKRLAEMVEPTRKYDRQMEQLAGHVKEGRLSIEQAAAVAKKYGERLDRVGAAGREAFGARAIGNLKSYITGLTSIASIVGMVRTELTQLKEMSDRITQTHLTVDAARAALVKNLVAYTPQDRKNILKQTERMAAELSIEPAHVYSAMAEAISSTSRQQAFASTRIAAQAFKEAPGQIGAFAGALADVGGAIGSRNAMRNLGFMLAVGAQSRVTSLSQQAESIPGTLVSATQAGATPEEAGALFASFSRSVKDRLGKITANAVINMTGKMREFFDKEVESGTFKATAVDTFAERRAELLKDPALAKRFLEMVGGQVRFATTIEQFFTDPQSIVSREFQEAKGAFGTTSQQQQRAREVLGLLQEGGPAATRALNQVVTAGYEAFALRQPGSLTDEASGRLIDLLYAAQAREGMPKRWRWAYNTEVLLRTGADITQNEALSLISEQENLAARSMRGGEAFQPTAEARSALAELRAIREALTSRRPPPSGRQE